MTGDKDIQPSHKQNPDQNRQYDNTHHQQQWEAYQAQQNKKKAENGYGVSSVDVAVVYY